MDIRADDEFSTSSEKYFEPISFRKPGTGAGKCALSF